MTRGVTPAAATAYSPLTCIGPLRWENLNRWGFAPSGLGSSQGWPDSHRTTRPACEWRCSD